MRKITTFTILILILTSCTNSKRNNLSDCEIISDFTLDRSKVELINSVVFDTTAILVNGTIIDLESKAPLNNAEVKLYNKNINFIAKTDSSGEFKIFENLKPGQWDILIQHDNYDCLVVKDIIKSGGQWFVFKLNRKNVTSDSMNKSEKELSINDNKTDSIVCNIDIVLSTLNNIDSLSDNEIRLFLKTFSQKCRNNVEFSEFSNEMLFKVLEKHSEAFLRIICDSNSPIEIDFETIYEELKSPLHDLIPVVKIKAATDSFSFKCERADSVINALTIALESM
jgi:hypothetical protein